MDGPQPLQVYQFGTVRIRAESSIGKMRVILWTKAAIVSSTANGKFLLWQNYPYFAYRKEDNLI